MNWEGQLEYIYIADRASRPMQERAEAKLIEGVGIEGDHYATGKGFYSKTPRIDRQCTLIEIETLDAILRDHKITVLPGESRRNLTTRGVPLNHLVGREFNVGRRTPEGRAAERALQVPGRIARPQGIQSSAEPLRAQLQHRPGRDHPLGR